MDDFAKKSPQKADFVAFGHGSYLPTVYSQLVLAKYIVKLKSLIHFCVRERAESFLLTIFVASSSMHNQHRNPN